jgi:hypothetical protein
MRLTLRSLLAPVPLSATVTAVVLAALVLIASIPVHAGERGCKIAILKESARFLQKAADVVADCEDFNVQHQTSFDCQTDPLFTIPIEEARSKARGRIINRCCGSDRVCGEAQDPDPGWGGIPNCPDFEHKGCVNAINNNPPDIADCTVCVAEAAVFQLTDLLYGALNSTSDGSLERCQREIGDETVKFFRMKSKVLAKCWRKRLGELHNNDCPDPGDDSNPVGRIVLAEARARERICKRCGGADQLCGGGDDFRPAEDIGFASDCPAVTVPTDGGPHAGENCGRPIATLQDLVDCVLCVAEFKVDCADDLSVPQFESYSANCNP